MTDGTGAEWGGAGKGVGQATASSPSHELPPSLAPCPPWAHGQAKPGSSLHLTPTPTTLCPPLKPLDPSFLELAGCALKGHLSTATSQDSSLLAAYGEST